MIVVYNILYTKDKENGKDERVDILPGMRDKT